MMQPGCWPGARPVDHCGGGTFSIGAASWVDGREVGRAASFSSPHSHLPPSPSLPRRRLEWGPVGKR